jgi:hypothetical protein
MHVCGVRTLPEILGSTAPAGVGGPVLEPLPPPPPLDQQVVRAIERDRENCVEISHYFVCKMRTVQTVHKYVKCKIHTELLKLSNILISFLCYTAVQDIMRDWSRRV